jgi:ABC-type dipeptide/oligopeptide/nickel transport system permease component
VLLGMFMLIGIIVVLSNFITDLVYTRLDPRIRLS